MNPKHSFAGVLLLTLMLGVASAQGDSTPASTPEEREAFYTQTIERRVGDILKTLDLKDGARAGRVHDILVLQYRSLRLRDAAISAKLAETGVTNADAAARAPLARELSKPLHQWFISMLALDLTPDQIETVKNQMTYNKVKVTFEAYCAIIPNLTDADKSKIMELLKAAREEAVDGGSAGEKSAIFQKYKDQINEYLNASGHDVAKAYREWEAKQPAPQSGAAAVNTATQTAN